MRWNLLNVFKLIKYIIYNIKLGRLIGKQINMKLTKENHNNSLLPNL